MNDPIERQEEIDVVKHAWAKGLEPTQYLEELPSAQPNLTEEDIRLLKKLRTHHNGTYAKAIDHVMVRASAQPEIIRCEDCNKCQIDIVYHEYWCDGKKVSADHFCGYAERKKT